jgi:hypothetical protein
LGIAFWHQPVGSQRHTKGNHRQAQCRGYRVFSQNDSQSANRGNNQEIRLREQRTPEAFRALQKVDLERWRPIIKANIKGE